MMYTAFQISLQITAIYMLFQPGMLLGWLRIFIANGLDKYLGKKPSMYLQKPLWECLICMSSVWTIILSQDIDLELILIVCGINTLIDFILSDERVIN